MARPNNRLSARQVQTLKEPGRHADGAGLYLQVDASLAKRWVFVFLWEKARKEMGLGSLAIVGLAEARELAAAARRQVAAGVNPIEERRKAKEPPPKVTFGDVAQKVLQVKAGELSNDKHLAQWRKSLDEDCASLTTKPVDEVRTEDVLEILSPRWTRTPETASRLRGRIEKVLDAAKALGHRAGENPARWRGHLVNLLSKPAKLVRGHHAAMPYEDVPGFMSQLRERQGVSPRALEFAILAAARSEEVFGARWREINFGLAMWIVPAERMKGRREHRVALSDPAVELLKSMLALVTAPGQPPPPDAYVFPGARPGRPLSVMAMERVLFRMGVENATPHGFRSSFRDWAGDTTPFAREIVEAALAHLVGNKVELAYRRGDAFVKRRKLMAAWADYCGRPAGGQVVAFTQPSA